MRQQEYPDEQRRAIDEIAHVGNGLSKGQQSKIAVNQKAVFRGGSWHNIPDRCLCLYFLSFRCFDRHCFAPVICPGMYYNNRVVTCAIHSYICYVRFRSNTSRTSGEASILPITCNCSMALSANSALISFANVQMPVT